MFKELYPLAQASRIAMNVEAEDDKLRVTIARAAGKSAAAISISVLGTPDELDADLPAAIAQAAGDLAQQKPIAEQVRAQVTKAKPAAKSASTPKPAAAKKTAAAPKVTPPKAEKPGKSAGKSEASQTRATAEECLAEIKSLYAVHGNALTREKFIENAKTARSFERRFGGWKKFVEAAGFSPTGQETTPRGADNQADDKTMPLPLDDTGDATAATPPAGVETAATQPAQPEQPPESATESVTAEASAAPAQPAQDEFNQVNNDPPKPPIGRTIKTMQGMLLAGGHTEPVEMGAEFEITGHGRVRVRTFNDECIFVDLLPPPLVRNVIDEDGEKLGTWEGEIDDTQPEITVNGIRCEVARHTPKAVFVVRVTDQVPA